MAWELFGEGWGRVAGWLGWWFGGGIEFCVLVCSRLRGYGGAPGGSIR